MKEVSLWRFVVVVVRSLVVVVVCPAVVGCAFVVVAQVASPVGCEAASGCDVRGALLARCAGMAVPEVRPLSCEQAP